MGPINRRIGIVPLRCGLQHYPWGGLEEIPRLLGVGNATGEPFAELWIGAHPDLPSTGLVDGAELALDRLIEADPEGLLGPEVAARFNRRLPFLLKILSARAPLSIQAHPNREQAHEGFARENAARIARSDRRRNYRDENHKPELICALTDFYALRGFRPLAQISQMFEGVPEFAVIARRYRPHKASLAKLYARLMRMDQGQVDTLLRPLLERLQAENRRNPFTRAQREFWVLRADEMFAGGGHTDRGIFSVFLLNLVHLLPGEAMYLPAGELHAYLEGTGVEVMANSNNVLRGGLTSKHVAVGELLAILTFECAIPTVLAVDSAAQLQRYSPPVEEFELVRLSLEDGRSRPMAGDTVTLGIVTEGKAVAVDDSGRATCLPRGTAFLVPHGVGYELRAEELTEIYLARVPQALRS
jgi:mannose-6-phosphate isomerase class I